MCMWIGLSANSWNTFYSICTQKILNYLEIGIIKQHSTQGVLISILWELSIIFQGNK